MLYYRFLHVCVSSEKSELWIAAIKNATVVYDRVLFILQSSTNSMHLILVIFCSSPHIASIIFYPKNI